MNQQLSDQIAILILFYNKVDQTISCINSFLPSGQDIYVLNNGSDPVQERRLRKSFEGNSKVHLLNAGSNLGPAGGRNYLISHTTQPWLFSVDNDILVSDENQWYSNFLLELKEFPSAEVFLPQLFNKHENAFADYFQMQIRNQKVYGVITSDIVINNFPAGAAIVSRSVYEKHGLYDENLFAFEDFELAIRVLLKNKEASLKCYRLGSIQLIHDHKYQKSKIDKSTVLERYNQERMAQSFEYLVNKHNISFDHDWNIWTQLQVKKMITNPMILHGERIINKLSSLFFKATKKIRVIIWNLSLPIRMAKSAIEKTWKPQRKIQLDDLFHKLSADRFSFIQIGANDGVTNDKLRVFILKYNWQGILVEPVPYVYERLKFNYDGVDGLAFENCAISEKSGVMKFYSIAEYDSKGKSLFHDFSEYKIDQLGSFDRATLMKHAYMHPEFETIIKEIEVPCLSFHDLINKYHIKKLDLLLVDAEGYDHKIIQSIDLDYFNPKVIIFEHHHLRNNDYRELVKKLICKYDLFVHGWDTVAILK
ncbi:FkbM family methyltransferase [Aquiflexum sp. LQ15W]|uniref:FkbM family methyltransferase n=1 Tax=Cognataquiflexum nitidum TaxID=2922272 RepID=UPI001F12E4A3|nr:FkbM family methyltransferase [Cognataquiflexum nitidum]MCH6201345.1 FkbM family methyltransferase [Cognataquiflexum nitidum]